MTIFNLAGTIREQTPEVTLASLKPIIKKIGVTRVANATGLDNTGIDVVNCFRPNSKHISNSQGKGISLELATISALMEAVEGYHIENPPAVAITGKYNDLISEYPLIDPTLFLSSSFENACLKELKLPWIKAEELFSKDFYYLPQMLTCIDTTRQLPEYAFMQITTNGLAAGNSFDEAVSHGLLEAVERHSFSIWKNFVDKEESMLNLDSITDSNKTLIKNILQTNFNMKIWDISQVGIPAFHCAIEDRNVSRGLGIATGTGAHVYAEIALSRAITEAIQSRLTLIAGIRDDIFPEYYSRIRRDSLAVIDARKAVGKKIYSIESHTKKFCDFAEVNQFILDKLYALEFKQIFLVNHTKSEINIPVIQVIAPGFQFNHSRI